MLFNSVEFLIFLPITFVLYFVCPKKYRHIVLLIASYIFYAFWNYKLVFLILSTTLIAYGSGLLFPKVEKKSVRICVFVVSILSILGFLFFFKYTNFLLETISNIRSAYKKGRIQPLDIILPVGISFYTFQTLAYVVDVYLKKTEPEKNFFYFALFVSFFPQLVAGPIEKPERLLPQLKEKQPISKENMSIGLKYMLVGFFKKIVVADMLAIYVNRVFNSIDTQNGITIWIGTILFSIQILCDFGGYSDIAIGTAKLFNIDLMKNFDHPYRSKSIKEFWNRWHISLSSFLKEYVYFPLGGSRVNKLRWCLNIMIVFLVSGIWHGAAWTFILWGLLHGVYQIIGNLMKEPLDKIHQGKMGAILRMIGTYLLVCFAWISFRSNSLGEMLQAYKLLFTGYHFSKEYFQTVYTVLGNSLSCIPILLGCSIGFLCIDCVLESNLEEKMHRNLRYALYIILVWIIIGCFIYQGSSGVESSFIYFQF